MRVEERWIRPKSKTKRGILGRCNNMEKGGQENAVYVDSVDSENYTFSS
jgi:hypothetical protein